MNGIGCAPRGEDTSLRDQKSYYRALLTNLSDVVLVLDGNAVIRDCSPSVTRHFGWDAADLIGTDAFALVHSEDRTEVMTTFRKILATPGAEGIRTCRVRRTDGSYCRADISGVNMLRDQDVQGVVANVRATADGSTAPTTETRSLRDVRAEALKLMAAGVAHDLNLSLIHI